LKYSISYAMPHVSKYVNIRQAFPVTYVRDK
jgi:hypothetical protein